MTSIYRRVLGSDFARLHPKIQERFGFCSADRVASIGKGVMHRISHGSSIVKPFLWFGTLRNIMFPEQGTEIPFQVENYAFHDATSREVVSWVRTFTFPSRTRRFDAYMALNSDGSKIVDFFGTHGHYSSDLHLSVTPRGGLRMESGAHRFHFGRLRLPFPELLAGRADVEEWYDDAQSCYRIRVRVVNGLIGPVLEYDGSFQATREETDVVPVHVMPMKLLPGSG
jgi:hypothetical protein